MHLITYLALFAGIAAFSLFKLVQAFRAKNPPDGPPGPIQFPWVGRIHDLPIQYMWLKFYEWAQIHGNQTGFYCTEMLGAKFLVVCEESVAEDLLIKRAKYNSDRPVMRSLFDKYWSRQRKLTHAYLTQASSAHYHGVMYHEVKRWLARLLADPDDFVSSLEDMASKVMCQLTWDDPTLSRYCTKSAWGLLTQMSPAGPITNVITPLWHLPYFMNPWKIAERKRHDEQQAWWMERLVTVRRKMAEGKMRPCWTRQYLETEDKSSLSGDYEASCVLGMLALVGIFTVVGPLSYFLVSMIHHPNWQRKVQHEIDQRCHGRLPTLDDAPSLPVLRACIKETMRWRPNVPTGVAHETETDDVYRGVFIPKGSRILPLDWAFLRNSVKYPDPETFRPERWLDPAWPTYREPLTQYPTIKGFTSFGWGQRQCLGQSLTQDELIVACGALLWCFNLKPKIDKSGCPIPVRTDKSNSLLIIKPDPFEMAFEPRSNDRKIEALDLWLKSEAQDRRKRAEFLAVSHNKHSETAERVL